MTFRFNNLQPVRVRLTEKIGWVNARYDVANGGNYYHVAHTTAGGDYTRRWYAEHELIALPESETCEPPGISYIDPPGPPPGGEDPPGDPPPGG
jgi:hypothetical protein